MMVVPRPGSGVLGSPLLPWTPRLGTQWSCQAKASRFVADNGNARKRRYLPKDVVVALLSVSGFRVKTYVCSGLGNGDA